MMNSERSPVRAPRRPESRPRFITPAPWAPAFRARSPLPKCGKCDLCHTRPEAFQPLTGRSFGIVVGQQQSTCATVTSVTGALTLPHASAAARDDAGRPPYESGAQAAGTTQGLKLVQPPSPSPQADPSRRPPGPVCRAEPSLSPAGPVRHAAPIRAPVGRTEPIRGPVGRTEPIRGPVRHGPAPQAAADGLLCRPARLAGLCRPARCGYPGPVRRAEAAPQAIRPAGQAGQGDRGDGAGGVRGGGGRRGNPVVRRGFRASNSGPGQRDERAVGRPRCRRPPARRSRPLRVIGRAGRSAADHPLPPRLQPEHRVSPAAQRAASSPGQRRRRAAVQHPSASVQQPTASVRRPVPQSTASCNGPGPRTRRHGR